MAEQFASEYREVLNSVTSIQGWQDEVRRIPNEIGKFYGDLMGDFDSKLSGYGISLIKNELSVRLNKKHEVGVGGKIKMIDLNAIAKSEGYDSAEYIGITKDGYKAYVLGFERVACVGLPGFILVKDRKYKIVDGEEGFELFKSLHDSFPDDEDGDEDEGADTEDEGAEKE